MKSSEKNQVNNHRKKMICGIIAMILVGIILLCVYQNERKYTENDFGVYFQFEDFQLTVDEVIAREKELYNETTYDRADVTGICILLGFPKEPAAEQEYRTYRFDAKTQRLVSFDVCPYKQQGHLFLTAFKNKHKRLGGGTYWFGHIGSKKVVLIADTDTYQGKYHLDLVTKDYVFPDKESFWDIWG